jgi:hypothetical protein
MMSGVLEIATGFKVMKIRGCMLCLVLAFAAAPAIASDGDQLGYRLDVLLDADLEFAERNEQLKALRTAADAGHHASQCVLGRLAMQKSHSAETVAGGDYGDADKYLNACALGGDLNAMLVLAENELRARRPLEAMIWVQAYLKLAQVFGSDMVNSAAPYKAGLIARIERGYYGKRPSNEEVLEYVAGLLAKYGERIADRCEEGGCGWTREILPPQQGAVPVVVGGNRSMGGRFTRDSTKAEDELGYASFIVQINESGRAERVFTLESYPDSKAARELISHPRTRRFTQVEAGAGMRYMFMPVFLDNKAFDLIPNAPPKRRPPRS